ncbi:MAG: cell division protein ZapA [Desulfonatronovibrio sp. MSAO_Bac4]|nr:MAG: cell division protein ZapA [Desulfonatronovibrio sp. MSAO_Bac4]
MPEYSKKILGLDLTFKTDASPERVNQASKLLEERFAELEERGSALSKERILVFLLLSLADDYLQSEQKLDDFQHKANKLLEKIDQLETKSD